MGVFVFPKGRSVCGPKKEGKERFFQYLLFLCLSSFGRRRRRRVEDGLAGDNQIRTHQQRVRFDVIGSLALASFHVRHVSFVHRISNLLVFRYGRFDVMWISPFPCIPSYTHVGNVPFVRPWNEP